MLYPLLCLLCRISYYGGFTFHAPESAKIYLNCLDGPIDFGDCFDFFLQRQPRSCLW